MQKQDPERWYLPIQRVEVPRTHFHDLSWAQAIKQRILRFLAPTRSLAFTDKHEYFTTRFVDQVKEYSYVRKQVKQLFLVNRSHRIAQLKELCASLNLSEPPEQWDDEVDNVQDLLQLSGKTLSSNLGIPTGLMNNTRVYDVLDAVPSPEVLTEERNQLSQQEIELLDQYCSSIKRTRVLRSHLQEVDEDLANYAHLLKTQATVELTYFRGFRDWCQVMLQLTSNLSNSLIAVSTLGAGLIYSTVFGATRGDVGLMCYCFPFFSCGFLLPVIIQIMLSWGANLQREAMFASQRFWTIVIGIFMSISSLAVMASLTILNLTVFLLKPDPTSDPGLDAPTTMAPGIIAFSITGSVFLLVLMGALLSAIAARAFTTIRGIRAVLSAVYGTNGQGQDALKLWLPV
ncbi:hypothetical protein MIND_01104700 [Mycena indigotica]|uniref:Uncharacterized protein n=1 Tax=Mycena indigotica TaxID=2126181 RepID=A0A8H6SD20_9AGAR|nr:uncharacterized protein MIND_01104700 [Mycena indigotica]KAF7295645.1 hypothetical protein MIND_01104700 [Mycena indigotica]